MNAGLQKLRLLLVEEDEIHRLLIREYLEMDPRFEVLEAKSIHHIHTFCKSKVIGIGLVLLDMEFSGFDCVNLILEIRKARPDLPIMGMTDRQSHFYAEKTFRSSGADFIPKPFSPFLLHRSIQALLKTTRTNIGTMPKLIPVRKTISARRSAVPIDHD